MYNQEYLPPFLMGSGHIQTVYPVIFRKVNDVLYTRERIFTRDRDFLDLDWSLIENQTREMLNDRPDRGRETQGPISSGRLAIISHGLEGSTARAYVKGMARALNQGGWDVLAWNYRSCSGEPNFKLQSYHNGATPDLAQVIAHAGSKGRYSAIALVGFSLGGNLTLVHLGRDRVDPIVKKAVVFSVPCDLAASAGVLSKPANALYMKRFLILLREKIRQKMRLFPGEIDDRGYDRIKNFKDFDDRYTAPIHGFRDARDYWKKCSSKQFIPSITVPTLIINAENDPFLPRECFPVSETKASTCVSLNMPGSGGHVGFVSFNSKNRYWSEQAAVDFLNDPVETD